MHNFIYSCFLLAVIGISCKSDKTIPAANSTNPNTTIRESKPTSTSLVKLKKADEAFIKEATSQKPFLMITDSIWNFYFALSISEATPKDNLYKGRWLDIKEDGSYIQGEYENQTDEGKYLYNTESKTIEFRSINKDTSSEWNVKVDPTAMVLIGTATYNNNPWQIKLVRKSGKPQAGVPLK
ncbi:MAG: hypothetical protein HOP11_09925 [Saprospiraceae bacterium]|nr:hypothetical protein [Saprospiraceae bacterium]